MLERYPLLPLPWREAPVIHTDNWDFQASLPQDPRFIVIPYRNAANHSLRTVIQQRRRNQKAPLQALQTVPRWPLSENCFYLDNSPSNSTLRLTGCPSIVQSRKISLPEEIHTPPASVPSSCLYTGSSHNQGFSIKLHKYYLPDRYCLLFYSLSYNKYHACSMLIFVFYCVM